jgi:hypothetical protein
MPWHAEFVPLVGQGSGNYANLIWDEDVDDTLKNDKQEANEHNKL